MSFMLTLFLFCNIQSNCGVSFCLSVRNNEICKLSVGTKANYTVILSFIFDD